MRAAHADLLDSELTCRDLVLAALLSLRPSEAGDLSRPATDPQATANAALVAKVLSAVVAVASHQATDCYGIPSWLIDGLAELLTCPKTESGWGLVMQRLADEVSVEGVEELHERLREAIAPPSEDFRRLRDGTLVVIDGTLKERPLAAASGAMQFNDLERLAQEAVTKGRSRIDRELGWRLQRIDVPIVCPVSENSKAAGVGGLLIGAQVVFSNRVTAKVEIDLPKDGEVRRCLALPFRNGEPLAQGLLASWRPVARSFEKGLLQGLAAALDLLAELGVEDEVRQSVSGVQVFLRGILPPAQVSDGSAGLPLALHVLAKVSDLPPPRITVSGTFADNRTLEGMSAEVARAKLEAVLCDGLKEGLMVYSPDSRPTAGIVLLAEPTLAAAARQVWGERWDEWTARTKIQALSQCHLRQGWAGGWRSGALFHNDQPMIVPTGRGEEISKIFADHPTVAFVGGPRQSGKTWIAQDVEDRMREKGYWQTLVFTVDGGQIPSKEDLVRGLRMFPQQSPTLLILDGLELSAHAEDLERDLNGVCSELLVSILVCIRVDGSTDWPEMERQRTTSIAGLEMVTDFATTLLESYPHLSAARPALGTILRGAAGDLWWVVRLIQTAALARPNTSYEELLVEFARSLPRSKEALVALQRLAALSLFARPAPAWFLVPRNECLGRIPPPIDDALRRAGARSAGYDGWILPSYAACEAILTDGALPGGGIHSAIERTPTHLQRFVETAMERDDEAFLPLLEHLDRTAEDILFDVVGLVIDPLNDWACHRSSLDSLTRLLAAAGDATPEKVRVAWAQRLARLVTIGVHTLHPQKLCDALDVLRRHSFALELLAKENDSTWHAMIAALTPKNIERCLRNAPRSRARVRLMWSLWRLHDEHVDKVIVANAALFVSGGLTGRRGAYSATDYWTVLELDRLWGKVAEGLASTQFGRPGADDETTRRTAGLHDLLQAAGRPEDGIEVLIGRLLVRLFFQEEPNDHSRLVSLLKVEVPKYLVHSTLRQLSYSLSRLTEYDRPLAVKIANGCFPASEVLALAKRARASEVAAFLGTAAKLLSRMATDLLYTTEGDPNTGFAASMADRILASGDGKGAGLLLKSAASIDGNYGRLKDGFATCLAEKLGSLFFLTQLSREPRTSVLYHLLEGMLAAGVSFSDEIKERTLDTIASSIAKTLRPRAPRLALLLAGSDWSEHFAAELSQQLSEDRILLGMLHGRQVESLTYFQELGPYLFPDKGRVSDEEGESSMAPSRSGVAARFVAQLDSNDRLFSRLLQVDRPEVLVRAALAISNSLRRGTPRDEQSVPPGRRVLQRIEQSYPGVDWPERLVRAGTPGDLAETLRGLRKLDPEAAANAVRAKLDHLARRVNRALREPQLAIELLAAIESTAPGEGRSLMARMAKSRAWSLAIEDLRFEQDPRLQGKAFLELARLGYFPSQNTQGALHKKWSTIIHQFSSPPALLDLLRMFAAWDLAATADLTRKLQTSRVARRLLEGARSDLQAAEGLIAALLAVGSNAEATICIEAVMGVSDLGERLGLKAAASLLSTLGTKEPRLADRLVDDCAALVARSVASKYVFDDTRQWIEIGWAAYRLRPHGRTVVIEQPPPTFEPPKGIPVEAWSTCWLDTRHWTEQALKSAMDRQSRSSAPIAPWAAALVLCVAAHRKEIRWLVQDATTWHHAADASPYVLVPLLEAAKVDDDLLRLLTPRLSDMKTALRVPHFRTHPARPQAERLLHSLATNAHP